jgi:hypothetical protein
MFWKIIGPFLILFGFISLVAMTYLIFPEDYYICYNSNSFQFTALFFFNAIICFILFVLIIQNLSDIKNTLLRITIFFGSRENRFRLNSMIFIVVIFFIAEILFYYNIIVPIQTYKKETSEILRPFYSFESSKFIMKDSINQFNDGSYALFKNGNYSTPFNMLCILQNESNKYDPNKLKYIIFANYEPYESQAYNSHSTTIYTNPLPGTKDKVIDNSAESEITTYKINAYIFDIKSKQCLMSKTFIPKPLCNSYYNEKPELSNREDFINWLANVCNCSKETVETYKNNL